MKLFGILKNIPISFTIVTFLAGSMETSATSIVSTEMDNVQNSNVSYAAKANRIEAREKNAPSNPLKNAYFGETHLHTSYSLDAYIGGNRMSPSDAYHFAKGETVMINGKPHTMARPLDFCAVTDHAEYIGEMFTAMNPQAKGYDQEELKELRSLTDYKEQIKWFIKYVISVNRGDAKPAHTSFFTGFESTNSAWQANSAAVNEHYAPVYLQRFQLLNGRQHQRVATCIEMFFFVI